MIRKKFWGGYAGVAIGLLMLVSGMSTLSSNLIGAPVVIFGSLAYISAKKRKLGLAPSSQGKIVMEIVAIIVGCLFILLQNNLADRMYTDPFINLFIPLWVIVAYVVVATRVQQTQNK